MKEPRIPLALEGYPFIGFAALVTVVSALGGYPIAAFLGLLATGFICYFFRDPERVQPLGDAVICSPADGRILRVEHMYDSRFFQEEVTKVSIFMNVFDVHVNRGPVHGKVVDISYRQGRFLSANTDAGGMENEQCALVFKTAGNKKIAMVQIAGLIARRIVCWAEKGDDVVLGQRVGLIRFGSRVDLYLPRDSSISVRAGQRVRAGETVLGVLEGN